MNGQDIDIIENLIEAISILNKTDEYLENLVNMLSECDSLKSDYEHLIENTPVEEVNLRQLYLDMQENFVKRRRIKNDITLRDNYKNLTARLNNSTNREFLLQSMKNVQSKFSTNYHNRILTDVDLQKLKNVDEQEIKKTRGRPKKMKDEVIINV